MKLSISCRGGHTEPTIGGRGDDHAICNLLNEVQIPVAGVGGSETGRRVRSRRCSHISME